MAKDIFPRRPIQRPHASIEVDSSGIGGSASNSEKILCLIGKAEGGEPNTVYQVRNYAQAKSVFRSGELLDAIELAWGSNPQYTAGKILAMRVEDAKASQLEKGGLRVTSKIFGSVSNDIQVALEKNTITDSLRLRVVFQKDNYQEVFDNLGNIFSINYKGEGEKATFSVEKDKETQEAKRLVLKVDEKEVKAYELNGGAYSFTNEIITDINELPDFEAKLSPFGDKNLESRKLDEATDVDIKGKAVYVKAVFGDIENQTQYNQYVKFEQLPEQASEPSDVEVHAETESATVTATSKPKAIEPFELTKLSGGTNGEPPTSWSAKLEKFKNEGGYYIVPLTDRQSVHSEVATFVKNRSDAGEPMRAIVGGGTSETKEKLFGRQAILNNPRVALVANSGKFVMGNGRILQAPAYMVASAVAGLVSGLDIGESITFKPLFVNSLDKVYESEELDELNENGIITIEFVRNRMTTMFRIVDDVTTFPDKNDPVKSEMALGEANDFLVSELKILLEEQYIGTRTINTSASQIKDFVQSYLGRKKRDNEIQDFPPEDVQVIIEGNEARISLTIFPIRALKKISVSLVYRQQTLQA
ncbi:major tail sheath protein [Staphylococcus phage Twort]|uniref:Tail sheath protein n=3 Tax=Twortvirus twort TaxID=55510 RepID=TSP_BPTWO|nr:tail sheath [Staphylococcus phage Twort]Q4Z9F2.1 RecName: Full=Tail sheath protein; Short=TSP [Staphylococcus phage Twort DSM 17442]AAX92307.1 ORF011 [Staphylococcus phage Twort]QIW89103.1 major tail sheath protein [Staphylococcus phage Twort]